jgi:flavin-dependent dehydrogenase
LQALCLAAGEKMARVAMAGVALSREAFDTALVRAAIEAGAAFLPGTLAALGEETSDGRGLNLREGKTAVHLKARIILAADGLGGNLLAQAGLSEAPPRKGARIGAGAVFPEAPRFYEPGTVFMACGAGGYLGLVRLEDGRLNLAAALDAGFVRGVGGLGAASALLLAEVGWPEPFRLEEGPWRGTPALTRSPARLAASRVFVLGDAAGYVEPFTGEGMAWALESAAAVVPIALQAIAAWRPELAAAWTARHRHAIGRRFTCRVAAAVLRRPWLVRGLVALLGHVPDLAVPVVRHLNGPHTTELVLPLTPDS